MSQFLPYVTEFVIALSGFLVALLALAKWLGSMLKKHRDESRQILDTATRKIDAKANALNGALIDFCAGLPYPAWFKLVDTDPDTGTTQFVMQFINPAYERFFGKTADEYIGRTDYQVWPKHIADAFYKNDAATMASGTHLMIREAIPEDMTNPAGPTVLMDFEKWPIERAGKRGIAGFMRPVINHDELKANGNEDTP